LEATLHLQIYGPNGQQELTVVIDTGYNGSLSLPLAVVAALSLPRLASRDVTLGDASRKTLDFYRAEVEWDGQKRAIPVLCVEGDPLLGTALLKGYKMEADFVVDGPAQIAPVV
jgi:clan AA aspartic protease